MTRGRKRKMDPTVPGHIDQAKLPVGCYWHRRDRYWYALVEGQKPRFRMLGSADASLSDLHHAVELLHGVDRSSLDHLLSLHAQSRTFAELSDTTRDGYRLCRTILQNYTTRQGVPFASLKLSRITLPTVQVLVDELALGKRRFNHVPARETPSMAAAVQRYLSAVFAWGMPRGHCQKNAAEGVDMPKERKAHRMPSGIAMKSAVALFRRRGAKPTRTRGSLAPYVWAVAVIVHGCRMRGIEARALTDADATRDGIVTDRRKGSFANVTRWSPELREAWDWLVTRRAGIWAKKKIDAPNDARKRYLVVTEAGQPLTRWAMKSAWSRAMDAAVATGVIDPDERFGLHALKHRGITDTKGTKADKQLASGHKSMQMVHHYDHALPVVDPARHEEE